MKSEQGTIEILQSVQKDINSLILQGVLNWQNALNAYGKTQAVIDAFQKEERAKKREEDIELEKMKRQREQQLKEAAERGEEIIGGETVRLYPDGTQKVLIP